MENDVTIENQHAIVRRWLGSGSINIFGIQFAGKDTQCRRLAEWLAAPIVGGGEISRNKSGLSPEARAITEAGGLIPIDEFLRMAIPYLQKKEFANKPLLLSAVGRWYGEEAGVLQAAEAAGHGIKAVILLDLDEDTVWKRWQLMHHVKDREKRVDDSEDGLKKRISEYNAKTIPVLNFYRKLGLVFSIDGSKAPDEVEQSILEALVHKAKQS
jgi:adenylate kinase